MALRKAHCCIFAFLPAKGVTAVLPALTSSSGCGGLAATLPATCPISLSCPLAASAAATALLLCSSAACCRFGSSFPYSPSTSCRVTRRFRSVLQGRSQRRHVRRCRWLRLLQTLHSQSPSSTMPSAAASCSFAAYLQQPIHLYELVVGGWQLKAVRGAPTSAVRGTRTWAALG